MPVTYAEIGDAINETYRDYTVSGLPSSGPHEPIKQEIRETLILMATALDDGGFSEPPDWAADLAAVLSQIENIEEYANGNASLASLADTEVGSPTDGQPLIYSDGKWRNGGDSLVVGFYAGTPPTASGFLLSRDMDDDETEAGHGFADNTYFRRGGSSAYAAFDAATQMIGNSYDHYVSIQARPNIQFGSSGQEMTNLYGLFDHPTIDTGTVVNRYGARIEAPTLSNGGSVDNHYGLFIEALTGNASAWAIFVDGPMASQLGDRVIVGDYGATSTDPGVVVSRNMFDGSTVSGHGFVEASYFRRGGTSAQASFDAATIMAGFAYDHGVSFQSRLNLQAASIGSVFSDLYGLYDQPTINAYAVTSRYGSYIAAPTIAGGGTIATQYGYYVEALTGATANWAFYSAGATPWHLGGYIEIAEMTAPSAPAANNVRVYSEDNGVGKTRLMALFPSGAAQQIAIQP